MTDRVNLSVKGLVLMSVARLLGPDDIDDFSLASWFGQPMNNKGLRRFLRLNTRLVSLSVQVDQHVFRDGSVLGLFPCATRS